MRPLLLSLKAILLILFFTCTTTASAKAPVWKVSKGGDYLYLGGTIHLLSKNDYPLPAAFESAYKDAEHVWFEADMSKLVAPETQFKMLSVMMYQDQRALSTILNRDTYENLSGFLDERKMPIAALDKLTPAGLMFTLTALELKRLGLIDETAGVDLHFDERAEKDGKERLHLETIDEQLIFMQSMNKIEPNRMVKSMIEEVGKTSDAWEKLLNAWRAGDMQALGAVGIDDMKTDFPSIYQVMLVNRNNDWMQDIKKMIKSKEIEFVLVGALHMAGEDGLINKLTKAGYSVEQLD